MSYSKSDRFNLERHTARWQPVKSQADWLQNASNGIFTRASDGEHRVEMTCDAPGAYLEAEDVVYSHVALPCYARTNIVLVTLLSSLADGCTTTHQQHRHEDASLDSEAFLRNLQAFCGRSIVEVMRLGKRKQPAATDHVSSRYQAGQLHRIA